MFTGVIVKSVDKLVKFTEQTDVTFGEIEDDQIKGYIDTGEPM